MRIRCRVGPIALAWLAAATLGVGCRTPHGVDTAASGGAPMASWPSRAGQAVWRPAGETEEIAGDVLFADGGAAGGVIEFSKPALPLVRVVRDGERWAVHATGRGAWSGRGRPPAFGWVIALDSLRGVEVPATWKAGRDAATGGWWVENPRSGERIEGYLEGR